MNRQNKYLQRQKQKKHNRQYGNPVWNTPAVRQAIAMSIEVSKMHRLMQFRYPEPIQKGIDMWLEVKKREQEMSIKPIDLVMTDIDKDFVAYQEYMKRVICSAFKIPPEMLGAQS